MSLIKGTWFGLNLRLKLDTSRREIVTLLLLGTHYTSNGAIHTKRQRILIFTVSEPVIQ